MYMLFGIWFLLLDWYLAWWWNVACWNNFDPIDPDLWAIQRGKFAILKYSVINHMAQWNLFDVVSSVILKFPAVLKFPDDDL